MLADLLTQYPVECAYVIASLSGFTLTETIKRDRKGKAHVQNLSHLELRAVSGGLAAAMMVVVLVAFSELPAQRIAAHAAIVAVLFPAVVAALMMWIEKRSPGAARVMSRAAAGSASLDDTIPFTGPAKDKKNDQTGA